MTIELKALDTLFFRDGKPFTMGDDTWATGIFPPMPSVFYGMIRTAFAAQNNIPLEEIEVKTKELKINSIILKLNNEYIFPYPTDLFSTQNNDNTDSDNEDNSKLYHGLELKKNETISCLSQSDLPYVLTSNTSSKIKDNFGRAFLSDVTFDEYLHGKKDGNFYDMEKYIVSEAKIGIKRGLNTNTTEDGKLYRVGMRRLETFDFKESKTQTITFTVDFEGLPIADNGIMKFGGEGKSVAYNSIPSTHRVSVPLVDKYLKVYIATPAVFKNGYMPEFIFNKKYDDIDLELITYAIGKPVFVGGFDMKNRKPKPMKKAVPAGSVYYLKSDRAREIADKIHGKSISDEMSEQGFGICYCGTFEILK